MQISHGEWSGESHLTAALIDNTRLYGQIYLGPRKNAVEYTPEDSKSLLFAADSVARVLAG